MPAKKIKFEGHEYIVPDDATPGEIASIVGLKADTPETVQAPQQPTSESWADLRYPGVPSPNDLLGVAKGAGKAGLNFVETGANWLRNGLGMPSEPPRMTDVPAEPTGQMINAPGAGMVPELRKTAGPPGGQVLSDPQSMQEKIGSLLGKVGIGSAVAGAGGVPSVAGTAGGLTGAMLSPDTHDDSSLSPALSYTGGAAGGLLPHILQYISRVKNSGQAMQQFKEAGEGIPIDYSETQPILDRIKYLGNHGQGPVPSIASDIETRIPTQPTLKEFQQGAELRPPIDYPESADFNTGASKLSSLEKQSLKGEMGMQVGKLSKTIRGANAKGLSSVVPEDKYMQTVSDYATLKKAEEAAKVLVDALKKYGVGVGIGAVGGGATGVWAAKHLGLMP